MACYLEKSKDTIKTIIKRIKEKVGEEGVSLKFGFVAYRDHPPMDHTYVTKIKDLSDADDVIKFISE